MIHDPTINPYHSKINLWKRYIDDVLLLFDGYPTELTDSVIYINNSSPFLKFTSESSSAEISYLDLTISKDATNKIQTSIFRKPMSRNSILHVMNNHPKHVKSNIPTGQFLQIKRNYLNPIDFTLKSEEMTNRFKEKDYSMTTIQQAAQRAARTPRSELLCDKAKNKQQ